MKPLINSTPSVLERMRSMSVAVVNNPENPDFQIDFTRLVIKCAFKQETVHTDTIKKAVMICLSNNNVPKRLLFDVWHSLFFLNEDLIKLVTAIKSNQQLEVNLKSVETFIQDPFFHVGLKSFLLSKVIYEVLITLLRKYFLLCDAAYSEKHIEFLCALGMHCNLGEYIYAYTEEEHKKISELKESLNIQDSLDQKTIAKIALISCYEELSNLSCVEEIRAHAKNVNNNEFSGLIKNQIEDVLKTRTYYNKIPALASINNTVSSSVANQYEENPYPRWREINRPQLSEKEKKLSEGREILVAGCGTGKELINAALYYPNAQILGIDLSRASLAYAKQKAQELEINNVEFMQADILELEKLDKTFDMITCGGVLHHMEKPIDGWSQLIKRLKPDGALKIALYSKTARQSISLCREWIKEEGFDATAEGIREFRQKVIQMHHSNPIRGVMSLVDFYSLSMCRDLVFHVQEHQFTLPQIEKIVDELDMSFITLKCKDPTIVKQYAAIYPDDTEFKNLKNWHQFEQENPQSFWGMYPFWINHKGSEHQGKIPEWIFAQ